LGPKAQAKLTRCWFTLVAGQLGVLWKLMTIGWSQSWMKMKSSESFNEVRIHQRKRHYFPKKPHPPSGPRPKKRYMAINGHLCKRYHPIAIMPTILLVDTQAIVKKNLWWVKRKLIYQKFEKKKNFKFKKKLKRKKKMKKRPKREGKKKDQEIKNYYNK
jgi:hypothetical protein